MNIQEQIEEYIVRQTEPKLSDMHGTNIIGKPKHHKF